MKLILIVLISSLSASSQQRPKAETTGVVIERVRRDPTNLAGLLDLSKRIDDPQVIPTLQDAFVHNKGTRSTVTTGNIVIRLSQVIAAYLMERGVRSDLYFDELASYARDAITANPPDSFAVNAEGKEEPERGHSKAFDDWCGTRGLAFESCMAVVLNYDMDLNWLRAIRDSRSIPVFRQALAMSRTEMVGMAVTALAQLDDVESIPLIAKVCSTLPPLRAQSIARSAIDFNNPAIEPLFDRFILDPQIRSQVKQEWRAKISKEEIPAKEERHTPEDGASIGTGRR